MSDHVLLASAVHGGLASEALLPLLNWWHTKTTGGQRAAGGGVVAAVGAGAGVGSFDAVQCRLRKLEGPVSQHLNAAAVLAASIVGCRPWPHLPAPLLRSGRGASDSGQRGVLFHGGGSLLLLLLLHLAVLFGLPCGCSAPLSLR
jgi:hypothetical protein